MRACAGVIGGLGLIVGMVLSDKLSSPTPSLARTGLATTLSIPYVYWSSRRAWVVLSANTIVFTDCPPIRTVAKYLFIQYLAPPFTEKHAFSHRPKQVQKPCVSKNHTFPPKLSP